MRRQVTDVACLVATALLIATTPAMARTGAAQVTDPDAASPAGVIYAIPLDTARQDASPHRSAASGVVAAERGAGGGSGGAGGGGGVAGGGAGAGGGGAAGAGAAGGGSAAGGGAGGASPGRGGSGAGGGGAGATGQAGGALLIPGGQAGSLIHSANGFGSSSGVPGVDAALPPGLRAAEAGATPIPLLAILAAIVVLLVGGYAGWRSSAASRS